MDPMTAGAVFIPTGAEGAGAHFPWGAALAASDADTEDDLEEDEQDQPVDDRWGAQEAAVGS